MNFVEQLVGPPDPKTINKYYETVSLEQEVACLMLLSMSPDLQRTMEKYNAYDMLKELKTMFEEQVMFEEQAKYEMFEIVKAFHACKQEEGQSVSSYLLKLKSLDTLESLGYTMPNELGMSLILNSLKKNYDQFKVETPVVLAIQAGKIQKDKKKPQGVNSKDKRMNKLAYAPKPKILLPPKRDNPSKGFIYHHCKEGLRGSRKLRHKALSLYVGNGMHATIKAIKSFDLVLPTGLIFVLDDYKVFYFNAIPRDGIYEIDMHNLYPNVSSMSNVSNKRDKHVLDSSYLWHCRLDHINKKRMDKLQHAGILQLTRDESPEKCKSCIFRNMARKPFPHQVERAKDILGLIHNDVCGHFRFVSREGTSYFITFIDDFSRYGYVYLMKHKHEGYALESAVFILNMVPTKKFKRTPYVIWHGKAPKLSYLRVWGSINTKMQSVKDNQVWVLVEFPPNGQTVGSKWLFKKNADMDGKVHTFKSCLVAKGYTQTYDVDYEETFSHVADIRAIRILLAIIAFYDYEIWQMDVKTTFLNGHLSKDQASRSWNKRFDVEIKNIGFTQNPDESCVYLKASGSNVAFLILYVDDILLMRNNVIMLQEVKSWLYTVLVYGEKPEAELRVSCYDDASFQIDKDDTKSQTGYVFVLNGGSMD
nr:retrotransposon protein, putative, Ty1-copia subclass [Tanacetum cinerariifolium]